MQLQPVLHCHKRAGALYDNGRQAGKSTKEWGDPILGEKAAQMRTVNEDNSFDEGKGLDKAKTMEYAPDLRVDIYPLQGLVTQGSPQAVPRVSTMVILVSRPPWLWPITTISLRHASLPSGSKLATASRSARRSCMAEYAIGLPLS